MSDTRTAGGDAAARGRLAGVPIGELVFALGVVLVGGYALARAHTINVPIATADVGPRTFPYVVGALLVVVGLLLVVEVLRGHTGEAEEGEDVDTDAATDWVTVALLVGILVAHVFLIVPLGWAPAAAVLFAGAAWVLGARPWWRVGLTAVVVALIIQWVFAGLLGVSLPAGPFLDGVGVLGG